ncbi:MAG: type VI secretion system lipoprotein TssJ [Polyangiaceae bacterium]|nr:type VI secretion system lipoprotein TssJ [Polyangiaceae bacterium]
MSRIEWRVGRTWAAIAVCALALGAASCKRKQTEAKGPEGEPCTLQMVSFSVIASDRLNPTPLGEPRPVQIRIYQLKSDIRFLNASFEDVWKKDAETLQDDLVKVDEFPLYPNTRRDVKFERDESAQYVVAAALFMSPQGRSWYTSFEYPPAPGEGACGMAECEGEDCEETTEPVLNPKFYVWVEGNRVEDGIEHASDQPEGRTEGMMLRGGGPKLPGGASVPGVEAPSAPEAPAAPKPEAPSAPKPEAPGIKGVP